MDIQARSGRSDLKHGVRARRRQFKSDEDGRSVAAERRAKRHFRREDPFAAFSLAVRRRFGSGERPFMRCAEEVNDGDGLRHRLGDGYRLGRLQKRLHRRATAFVVAALLVLGIMLLVWSLAVIMMMRDGTIVVRFRSVVQMCRTVRTVVLMLGHNIVRMTGMAATRIVTIQRITDALHAAHHRPNQPEQRATHRPDAESCVKFWLSRTHTFSSTLIERIKTLFIRQLLHIGCSAFTVCCGGWRNM